MSEKVYIGDTPKEETETPETLEVSLNGETLKISCTGEDTILETLLNEGLNPPYSCMDGACMACMAKVVSGTVYQNDPGILTEDNIDEREALTCQARPCSKRVVIDYDGI